VIYLDTGCLVKLYYPEPDSAIVAGLVRGKPIWHTPLHELEFTNALGLKAFRGSATIAQMQSARDLVTADMNAGVLVSSEVDWRSIFTEARRLAEQHTPSIGCRSLDILHCAAAKVLATPEFLTTDARQRKLATAIGLNAVIF
jgi:predicted nucleic acid-binding protein